MHAALHATVAVNPLFSALLFADDQRLALATLLDAPPVTARLALLSACETATAPQMSADQALTLGTALRERGVHGVLSSTWSVHDHSTAQLVALFVDNLRTGMTPPFALQAAQRRLNARAMSPTHWAALQLHGS